MRIILNERRIRLVSALGQYGAMGGLLTLIAGLIISFAQPTWIIPMMACLALGFILTIVGGFFSDRYVGPLAHHKALDTALKGLDHRHVLLHYVLPASHVLLEPGGWTVFVVKTQGGEVTYQEEGRWKHKQKGKLFRQFAGQEAIGAPDYEAERQVSKLERWLAQQLPDVEAPVRGVIVFVNPNVTLEAESSPIPAIHSKKLKDWLRGPGKLKPLPKDVYQRLLGALDVEEGQ